MSECNIFSPLVSLVVPFTFLLGIDLCGKGKTIEDNKRFHATAKKKFQISSTNAKITVVILKKGIQKTESENEQGYETLKVVQLVNSICIQSNTYLSDRPVRWTLTVKALCSQQEASTAAVFPL